MRVFNLSTSVHAIDNIARRRIKISRYFDLNDPFELLGADLRDPAFRKIFRDIKDKLHRDNGLICFSRSWQNPVLWSHYADKHRGICLAFDVSDQLLEPVKYTSAPLKILREPGSIRPKLSQDLMKGLMITKFRDWEYEDESRLFVKLDHKISEAGMYFYPFSSDLVLREVILGPRCEHPIGDVRDLVASIEPHVHVTKARVAFTKFKVVEDRAITRKKSFN